MIGPDSATGRLALGRETFRLIVQPGGLFQVEMDGWSQAFRPTVSADVLAPDAAQDLDRTRSRRMDGPCRRGDTDVISWTERSTLWIKRHDLEVHRDHLVFRTEMRAGIEAPDGAVDTIRYFGDIAESGFGAHFALTKHFNDRGRTHPRTYSTGSPIGFRHVLCPEPNSYAQQVGRPFDDAQISVHADLDHRGGNFVANPGMLAFAIADERDGVWLAMGLAVEPGNHHFSEFEYLGGERFELALNCWGARCVQDGVFVPPAVVLAPGRSAEDALTTYVQVLRDRELVPRPVRVEQGWWRRPIVCGWGHQSYQSDLFRIRSTRERPPDNATYTLCTQLNYRHIVETLDRQDISWGTLVIDARWFVAGGLKDIDIGRWPDEDQERTGDAEAGSDGTDLLGRAGTEDVGVDAAGDDTDPATRRTEMFVDLLGGAARHRHHACGASEEEPVDRREVAGEGVISGEARVAPPFKCHELAADAVEFGGSELLGEAAVGIAQVRLAQPGDVVDGDDERDRAEPVEQVVRGVARRRRR